MPKYIKKWKNSVGSAVRTMKNCLNCYARQTVREFKSGEAKRRFNAELEENSC